MKLNEEIEKQILFAFRVGASLEAVMSMYQRDGLTLYKAKELRRVSKYLKKLKRE